MDCIVSRHSASSPAGHVAGAQAKIIANKTIACRGAVLNKFFAIATINPKDTVPMRLCKSWMINGAHYRAQIRLRSGAKGNYATRLADRPGNFASQLARHNPVLLENPPRSTSLKSETRADICTV